MWLQAREKARGGPVCFLSYQFLAELTADGGGDTPEDVLSGIKAALEELEWDLGPDTERQVFILAEAPPHLDYKEGPRSDSLIEQAVSRRIVINAIGCRSRGASCRRAGISTPMPAGCTR